MRGHFFNQAIKALLLIPTELFAGVSYNVSPVLLRSFECNNIGLAFTHPSILDWPAVISESAYGPPLIRLFPPAIRPWAA